ncbi:MAG: glycosyltransferase 87 family protein [Chloroflexota bacterium]
MRKSERRYISIIVGLFIILLLVYLLIANFYHAPRGYYGTIDQPRFADPWIARSETILNGGLLYRDVFTSTPPLTNLLLLPPSLIPILVGMVNPWATLSFMVYFSLFNLFTALVLLNTGASKSAGFWAAVLFLLNPLTFGNTVLRRQDESIVVFFVALSLLFILKNQHTKAAITIGVSLLVKLTGGLLIPAAFFNKRDWRYLVIPPLVFLIGLLPFLILAGRDAIFWDFTTSGAQHPFQFKGVSLMTLWNAMNDGTRQISILPVAIIMIVGVLAAAAIIARYRFGIVEDMIILTTAVFLFSPKLHTGYFSILVLLMAMLIKDWRLAILYFLFGALALVADFYKWPIIDYQAAFWLMVGVLILMVVLTVGLHLQSQRAENIAKVPVSQM